jgi:hypothetical protein
VSEGVREGERLNCAVFSFALWLCSLWLHFSPVQILSKSFVVFSCCRCMKGVIGRDHP